MEKLTCTMSADSKPYQLRKSLIYLEDQVSMFLHSVGPLGLSTMNSKIQNLVIIIFRVLELIGPLSD